MQRMNKAKDAKRRARKAERKRVLSTAEKRIEDKRFKPPRTQKRDPWFC